MRQWEEGVSSLPFLSLLVGYLGAAIIQTFIHLQIIDKKLAQGKRRYDHKHHSLTYNPPLTDKY